MADNNRIEIVNQGFGSTVLAAIETARRAREDMEKVYGRMNEYGDTDAGKLALAAQLGISNPDPVVTAAQAVTVRADVLNARNVLNGADLTYLFNRIGQ